ncbi:MAG: UDP-N-acetylmuramoyl-tripeptide--D-alanyl-D-alanine ligase [Clostridia bacterium]|nr:UDP-N-acetylmuramoyl-tripeptide--D-alanyl-D-alanine ligase [Clostridia bacterium]
MIELTLKEILACTGGKAPRELPEGFVRDITLDSRRVLPGSVFIAIKGERVDGHSFVKGLEGRVLAAVVEHEVEADVPQIIVPSTYKAVGAIGSYIRDRSGVIVVGVTGSVGKTSVKELTAGVVSQRFSVLKTEKNHNNELGLPMTLFRLTPENEVAVLEMGISYFGEMDRISKIAKPDIAVFTNIENVHTENLIDRDGVLRAKTELTANMRGNTLILNADDDKLAGYKLPNGKKAVYYGSDPGAFVHASQVRYNGMESTSFTLHVGGDSIEVELPASGKHMVLDALAAAAAGHELGLTMEEIKHGLESYVTVSGRMERIPYNGAVILNDCYNASPTSMAASLRVLANAPGRKLALLGDMLELGERAAELHAGVGTLAAELGLDLLVTVGRLGREISAAASDKGLGAVIHSTPEGAAELLKKELRPGDTLLVKASRGMALEKIIFAIME